MPGHKPLVWNPIYGCTKVSQGCKNCYAEAYFNRVWPGTFHNVSLRQNKLQQPLHWKAPSAIFVNSMSDLFHERVPEHFIYNVLETMIKADWHKFVVLTKRPSRMRDVINQYTNGGNWLPAHIAVGVSIEEQDEAYIRLPLLAETRADMRIVSAEPLLGELKLGAYMSVIDWVIVGGESGKHARPMKAKWALSLRNEAAKNDVPFFFKQWGEHNEHGLRVGKKAAGSHLFGQQWHQFPKAWSV
jgi:protein gp37